MNLETTLSLHGHQVIVVATIPGYIPDAQRVTTLLEQHNPDRLALGIPPEDLQGLQVLHDEPEEPLPEADPHSEALFGHLARFGECTTPSPELRALYEFARETEAHIEAVDMDDETHAEHYIKLVKFRDILRNGRTLKKLLTKSFDHCHDPYELALAWDQAQLDRPNIAAVEALREEAMAKGIYELAKDGPVFAWLPVSRYRGALARLEQFLS